MPDGDLYMNAQFKFLLACTLALSGLWAQAQTAPVKVQWLGQAAFKITSSEGKVIITDPWLKANPLTPVEFKTLENLGKVDVLLVTHGHLDHFADAPAIAKLNNVPMYAPGDMNASVVALGILPPELAPRFNKSGVVEPSPGIKVTPVHAEHSSVINWKNPATNKDEIHVGGEPVGFIIELEDGFKIYHMGDTGLFSDMKFIADYYKPDLVLIPIGGNFTMAPDDAAYALKTWIKPRMVIPMHYNSNPIAKGTLAEFQAAMKGSSIKIIPMTEGEIVQF